MNKIEENRYLVFEKYNNKKTIKEFVFIDSFNHYLLLPHYLLLSENLFIIKKLREWLIEKKTNEYLLKRSIILKEKD